MSFRCNAELGYCVCAALANHDGPHCCKDCGRWPVSGSSTESEPYDASNDPWHPAHQSARAEVKP